MPDTLSDTDILPLPPGDFAAYLFDLDGTLADSMPLHYKAWVRAVRENGGQFPLEMFYALGGVPLPRTVEILNERFGTHMDPLTVVHRKEALYLESVGQVKANPAVLAHVEEASARGLPIAIVSGSPRETILQTLATLGLSDRFQAVVGAEDYAHGKPDPEPFLTAAHRLGVDPARCLVFEDAELGIEAAKAAGMQWVRVPQNTSPEHNPL